MFNIRQKFVTVSLTHLYVVTMVGIQQLHQIRKNFNASWPTQVNF